MSKSSKPPSMSDFDYFSDERRPEVDAPPGTVRIGPESLEEQLAVYRRTRRRQNRTLFLAVGVLVAAVWFLWGYRDWLAYSFAHQPLLKLGDVARLDPRELPPNAYVQVEGVTEHRGLKQKLMRGLSFSRREFWYFRLLGSRGVFVEVEPSKERFGPATAVTVEGRVVDLTRTPAYHQLLASYEELFFPKHRDELRLIQVGVKPGTERGPLIAAAFVLLALFSLNAWAIGRIASARRAARRQGLLR